MTLAEARPVGQVEEDRQEAYRVPANFPRFLGWPRSKEERMLDMARALLERWQDPDPPKPFGAKEWTAVMKAPAKPVAEKKAPKAPRPRVEKSDYDFEKDRRDRKIRTDYNFWYWRGIEEEWRRDALKRQLEFARRNFQEEYSKWQSELKETGRMTYSLLKRAREYGFVVSDDLTPKQELDYSI